MRLGQRGLRKVKPFGEFIRIKKGDRGRVKIKGAAAYWSARSAPEHGADLAHLSLQSRHAMWHFAQPSMKSRSTPLSVDDSRGFGVEESGWEIIAHEGGSCFPWGRSCVSAENGRWLVNHGSPWTKSPAKVEVVCTQFSPSLYSFALTKPENL